MQFGIHHGAVKIYSLGTVLFFVNDIFVLKVSECIEYNDGCCGNLRWPVSKSPRDLSAPFQEGLKKL